MISIAGISVVATLAAVHAAAPAGLPVRVVWDAPAGCSDADSFFTAVASRAEHIHRAEPGEEGARLEVKLARLGPKVHGELRLITDDGRSDLRKVDGGTCDEVAEALSLTAALALSASARATASPPSSGPGTAAGTVSSTPQPAPAVPPVAPPAPPPAPPAATPSPFPVLPPAPPPAPPLAAPPADATAPPEPPPAAPSAPPGPGRSAPGRSLASWFAAGLGPAAGEVVSPYFSFGGMAYLRLEEPGVDHLGPSATLGGLYLRNDLLGRDDDAVFRLAAASLTVCPGWGWRGGLASIELCALGGGGWLEASDAGVTVSHSVTRSWWSAGAVLRARAPVGAGFVVQLDASASLALMHRKFVTTTPDRTVGTTPSVAPLFSLTVAHGL